MHVTYRCQAHHYYRRNRCHRRCETPPICIDHCYIGIDSPNIRCHHLAHELATLNLDHHDDDWLLCALEYIRKIVNL